MSSARRFNSQATLSSLVTSMAPAFCAASFSRRAASFSRAERPACSLVSIHAGVAGTAGLPSCAHSGVMKSSSRRQMPFSSKAPRSVFTMAALTQKPSAARVPPCGSVSASQCSTVGTPGWAMRISSMPLPVSWRPAWIK